MHNPNPSVLLNSEAENVLFQKIFGTHSVPAALTSTSTIDTDVLATQVFGRKDDYNTLSEQVAVTFSGSDLLSTQVYGKRDLINFPHLGLDSSELLSTRIFGDKSVAVPKEVVELSATQILSSQVFGKRLVSGGITDAPSDSIYYGRRNAVWTNLKTYFDGLYQAIGTYLTSANIEDSISSGVTYKAPSENIVFDNLVTPLASIRNAATELIISSDAITITQSNHKLQPESGSADNLSTINGTIAGQSGILYMADYVADVVYIKHNVGNILCRGGNDILLIYGCVFWYSDGVTVYMDAGEIPPTTALYDFQVGNGGGSWYKQTQAQTKTILGVPSKAAGTDIDTGTNDAKFVTAKALNDSHNVPDVAPGTSGNLMQSNGTDWTSVTNTLSSKVVQVVNTTSGAEAHGTTTIPNDDTVPQNTEGVAFAALDTAITPTNASNKLRIDVTVFLTSSIVNNLVVALFQDATTIALAVGAGAAQSASFPTIITFTFFMVAGTTSATTFKVRGGSAAAATVTFNGNGSARKYGGALASSMTITEYLP